ncbi:MAG: 4-phosphoerythronate dehydrogenase [Paludibacteraceae bacterium]
MRVVIDSHIPYIQGLLDPYAEVQYLEPQAITAEAVRDADALIVRTLTRCSKQLLEGSRVQLIATATIGFDHIDTDYCRQRGISWTNAPGCNAQGVCDYVETAIDYAESRQGRHRHTMGIVGVGHIGRLVAQMAQRKGYEVLLCDPPRAMAEGGAQFVSLEAVIQKADIITFHTPLTVIGDYPTYHLLNEARLSLLRPSCLIINAARGGIIDEAALLRRLSQTDAPTLVIDCWENEPNINTALLQRALLGTYHIAGYTKAGKLSATQMCLTAFCRHFDIPEISVCTNQENSVPLQGGAGFDIERLSRQLKSAPWQFRTLRQNYPLR